MGMRIALLLSLGAILNLKEPVFHLTDLGIPAEWFDGNEEVVGISIRDLIMLAGGLFLIGKSVFEIHEKLEGHEGEKKVQEHPTLKSVLIQIAILDIVFSLDSVITAVGMAEHVWVMVVVVIVAVGVILFFSEAINRFVQQNPTIKMLALSFLILIGVTLLAEGSGAELNKGYIYFAMAFSLFVEFLNIRLRRSSRNKRVQVEAT